MIIYGFYMIMFTVSIHVLAAAKDKDRYLKCTGANQWSNVAFHSIAEKTNSLCTFQVNVKLLANHTLGVTLQCNSTDI